MNRFLLLHVPMACASAAPPEPVMSAGRLPLCSENQSSELLASCLHRFPQSAPSAGTRPTSGGSSQLLAEHKSCAPSSAQQRRAGCCFDSGCSQLVARVANLANMASVVDSLLHAQQSQHAHARQLLQASWRIGHGGYQPNGRGEGAQGLVQV